MYLPMRKKIALLLGLLTLVSGLIAIEPVFTQISPPVPSFTLKLEEDSHDVTNATGTYHISIKFIDVVVNNTGELSNYAVVN
jgi:hypothetical protein